jgi:cytochrome c oxidase subunit IV
MFGYLALLFGVYIIQQLFAIQQYFITSASNAGTNFVITQGLQTLSIFLLAIVVEMFAKNTPYTGKQMFFAMLAAATIGGMALTPDLVVTPIEGTFLVNFASNSPETMLQGIFALIVGFWLLFALFRSRLHAKAELQKSLIKGMFFGTLIMVFVGSTLTSVVDYFATRAIFRFDITTVSVIGNVLQDLGMIVIGIAFIRISRNPWLLQQQQVYFILVISKEGLDIFSRTFRPEISPNDLTLFSGGFSAVSSMFKEVTKSESVVKSIMFEGKELRLINRKNFICALLVDYSTQASELAQLKFANDFEELFGEDLQNPSGNVTEFSLADQLAELYFA